MNQSIQNPTPLNPIPLNENNNLNYQDEDEVKAYQVAHTNAQFLKISIRKFMGKLRIDIRKWKKDIYHQGKFYPSDKGILIDADHFNDIHKVFDDIKQSGLIDKSV